MASKLEYYAKIADRTAMMVSGSYQSWTSFLTTVGRLYKYPYHVELAEAPGLERKRVAERLVDIERDLIHDGEKVYLPTIRQARGGGFPDEVERVVGLLQNADTLRTITTEYAELLAANLICSFAECCS